MTDGGKIARRSVRVFSDEINLGHLEKSPADAYSPVFREREERQVEKESHSRRSSRSSLPTMELGMKLLAGAAAYGIAGEVTKCLDLVEGAKEKIEGRPVNFGIVIPGMYRSGYPQTEDHAYLKSLGLKTIVTLVSKDYPKGYQKFVQANGIEHIVLDMDGTKKTKISQAIMIAAIKTILDPQKYPILIHCNHGKHRTGCVVAVARKVMGWRVESIIEEYTSYAHPKTREADISYIENFAVASLAEPFGKPRRGWSYRVSIFKAVLRMKMTKLVVMAALLLSVWALMTAQFRILLRSP